MVERIPGFWHILKEKITRHNIRGPRGVLTTMVVHFQTHALSNVLVTLCSGTEEPHSGSGRDFCLACIWTSVWDYPQSQHIQTCHASNGYFSKEEWTVHFLNGYCKKHIDFRRFTLMLHIGIWAFRSPYSDIATIYCTADVECRFIQLINSCNCKQKSSRCLWYSSDNCCTVWMRCGLNTKSLSRTLHTVVFDIDIFLAAVTVDFFGLCRKLARTRSTSFSAVNGRPLDFCLHRHPLSVNCLYHARMFLSIGGSFACFVRNARCTVTTELTLRLLISYIYGAPSKAKNANVVYIWT